MNKCNKIFHNMIEIKHADIKANTYTDLNREINDKNLKFKIIDFVRISK